MNASVCIDTATENDEAVLVDADTIDEREAGLSRMGIACTGPQVTENKNYTANDAGRARRFVDRHAENIRYVPEREVWLIWQDGRWTPDRTGGMERLAIELSQEMLTDLAKISGTDAGVNETRKAAMREALSCGDRKNIANMLRLAAIDLRVILEESRLDSDPWIVGARNAVIDLRTGTIRKYTKSDTRTLDVDANDGATCPRWEQFIDEIFPDRDVARFVQKAAGYSLTGITREQCFFFLQGAGANGKSTFLETLEAVLGRYAERAGKGLIAANLRGDYPLREAAAINGARLYWQARQMNQTGSTKAL
jgi:putative DNA primase/helicase